MALIVEDGTGLPNANALVDLTYADNYQAARANAAWAALTPELREAAIVRASSYMSNAYDWEGTRVKGRGQGQAWPRNGVTDCESLPIPNNEVPWEVKDATCEVAAIESTTPGIMTPSVIMGERITQETIGELSVSYELGSAATQNIPALPVVDNLIGCFLGSGLDTGSLLFGRSVRV